MSAIDVFHFDDDGNSFEEHGRTNGFRHWSARALMQFLQYEDWTSFKRAINKAMAACGPLSIPIPDNFVQTTTEVDGAQVDDFHLSRFACYLTAMNGDVKKPQVAKAQAYFASIAESFDKSLAEANDIERLAIRDEVSDRERSLSGVAKQAGVTQYPFFQNAGYRGMYNMNLSDLRKYKHLPEGKKCLLDFMGKEELAANLFRITQTEAKLKNEGIVGQQRSEMAAESVGRDVRDTMKRISNTTPEDLSLVEDIKETRKSLKSTHKEFKKIDENRDTYDEEPI